MNVKYLKGEVQEESIDGGCFAWAQNLCVGVLCCRVVANATKRERMTCMTHKGGHGRHSKAQKR